MIEYLSPGPSYSLVQNQIYALPAKVCTIYSASTTLQVNTTNATTGWAALATTTTGGARTSAQFLRDASGAPIVTIKVD